MFKEQSEFDAWYANKMGSNPDRNVVPIARDNDGVQIYDKDPFLHSPKNSIFNVDPYRFSGPFRVGKIDRHGSYPHSTYDPGSRSFEPSLENSAKPKSLPYRPGSKPKANRSRRRSQSKSDEDKGLLGNSLGEVETAE